MMAFLYRLFGVRRGSSIEPMDDASLLGRQLLLNIRRTTVY